jgi:alkylhydroperoxidase family enzyme
VLESYAFIRDHVLLDGPADQDVKQLCFRFLAGEIEPSGYEGRERAALDWAHAIAWDSDRAHDELWERLKTHFTEEELVDLGCAIGFELGQQHFVRTLGLTPELPHAAA